MAGRGRVDDGSGRFDEVVVIDCVAGVRELEEDTPRDSGDLRERLAGGSGLREDDGVGLVPWEPSLGSRRLERWTESQ